MAKKLPNYLINRWGREVDKRISGDESSSPSFAEFCLFVEKEARIACNPVIPANLGTAKPSQEQRILSDTQTMKNRSAGAFKVGTEEKQKDKKETPTKPLSCIFCQDPHRLECKKFVQIAMADRRAFIISKRLCWGCLRFGHNSSQCKRRKSCKTCNGLHPTSLHGDVPAAKNNETKPTAEREANAENRTQESATSCRTVASNEDISQSMIVPVWLYHVSDPNKKIMVYALLDEQSDACFVSNSTVSALNIAGQDTNLKISTVLAEETVKCQKISGLSLSAINNDDKIPLPKTYTRKTIPVCRDQIPNPETARQRPHLESLTSELMTPESNVEVGLLIGANCPRAIKPREVIPGNDDDPYAIRTSLGWGIIGRVSSNSSGEETPVGVSKIMSRDGCSTRKCCFSFRTCAKEIISPLQVNAMFERDFNESIANAAPLSHQGGMFMKKVLEPLTPNHLLTMKSKVILPPPGVFQRADIYSRKRWRRVQHLAAEFWDRWKKEFLLSLTTRQKWIRPRRNLQVNDVVIIKDDNQPRNKWQLARVAEVYPSDDGLVRKVKVLVADSSLNRSGQRTEPVSYLERPVQKVVLLVANDDVDRGIPTVEP